MSGGIRAGGATSRPRSGGLPRLRDPQGPRRLPGTDRPSAAATTERNAPDVSAGQRNATQPARSSRTRRSPFGLSAGHLRVPGSSGDVPDLPSGAVPVATGKVQHNVPIGRFFGRSGIGGRLPGGAVASVTRPRRLGRGRVTSRPGKAICRPDAWLRSPGARRPSSRVNVARAGIRRVRMPAGPVVAVALVPADGPGRIVLGLAGRHRCRRWRCRRSAAAARAKSVGRRWDQRAVRRAVEPGRRHSRCITVPGSAAAVAWRLGWRPAGHAGSRPARGRLQAPAQCSARAGAGRHVGALTLVMREAT